MKLAAISGRKKIHAWKSQTDNYILFMCGGSGLRPAAAGRNKPASAYNGDPSVINCDGCNTILCRRIEQMKEVA